MTKGQRILVFAAAMISLLVMYWVFQVQVVGLGEHGVVIMSALIMLAFTVMFAEHYFTRPTDVVASTIAILLLLSPLHDKLQDLGVWYWIFWYYNAFVLVAALLALLLVNSHAAPDATQNRLAEALKTVSVRLGNGKFLWFTLFALCLLFYVDSKSDLFIVAFAYAGVLLLIDPKRVILSLWNISRDRNREVAHIFGVQSSNAYLARMTTGSPSVGRLDAVAFRPNAASDTAPLVGLVLDTYMLNNEHWLRIITDRSLAPRKAELASAMPTRPGAVCRLGGCEIFQDIQRLVGVVSEGSSIERLKFKYAFSAPVQEGDLLQVEADGSVVLYQVVEGVTGTEVLDARDEAGFIIGEAVQLGVWNPGRRCFERYGWVPAMNKPVFLAAPTEPAMPAASEVQIGSIPGTNFPVLIDRELAVTHHLAVLGVTGSGKSVFSRNLLREIAQDGTKIICVDFTNEYGSRLNDLIQQPLVSGTQAEALFEAVDDIGVELDKFPNQRDRGLISRREHELRGGFTEALTAFLESPSPATLFELPDVTNSTGILEYTRWFFRALFDLAKADGLGGRRICVVLEEAHTIVPEWNFLGVDDKRSSSVVNSIAQIALQGRKYGVGFVVIAQRTANVSKTVLTQCNSVVAFQQFDRTSADFLGNYMDEGFVSSLTRLKPRHAVAVGKAFSSGTPVIFEVPQIEEPNGVNAPPAVGAEANQTNQELEPIA